MRASARTHNFKGFKGKAPRDPKARSRASRSKKTATCSVSILWSKTYRPRKLTKIFCSLTGANLTQTMRPKTWRFKIASEEIFRLVTTSRQIKAVKHSKFNDALVQAVVTVWLTKVTFGRNPTPTPKQIRTRGSKWCDIWVECTTATSHYLCLTKRLIQVRTTITIVVGLRAGALFRSLFSEQNYFYHHCLNKNHCRDSAVFRNYEWRLRWWAGLQDFRYPCYFRVLSSHPRAFLRRKCLARCAVLWFRRECSEFLSRLQSSLIRCIWLRPCRERKFSSPYCSRGTSFWSTLRPSRSQSLA